MATTQQLTITQEGRRLWIDGDTSAIWGQLVQLKARMAGGRVWVGLAKRAAVESIIGTTEAKRDLDGEIMAAVRQWFATTVMRSCPFHFVWERLEGVTIDEFQTALKRLERGRQVVLMPWTSAFSDLELFGMAELSWPYFEGISHTYFIDLD